jgi:hypothetical protein
MDGVPELPIRGPAVADQYAIEVRPEYGGGLVKAPPRLNGVDGRVRRGEAPEPL